MKTCFNKLKAGSIQHFKLKMKSKKWDRSASLYFRKRWIQLEKDGLLTLNWPKQRTPMRFKLCKANRLPIQEILMDCRRRSNLVG